MKKTISKKMKNINFKQILLVLFLLKLIFIPFYTTIAQSPVYPSATVYVNDNPSPGYMFLGSFVIFAGTYDNYGTMPSAFINKWPNLRAGSCFKRHNNGNFTYYDHFKEKFMVLNSSFKIIDSVKCVNGFLTDFHDITIKDNGNILIWGVDERVMNLSKEFPSGKENATVKGFVLQELSPSKSLIWQWSSFDYLKVTDAVQSIIVNGTYVSPWHFNSAFYDSDGNIIISIRFSDEIIKISRSNGKIIWRLGGQASKNNQFQFLDDTDASGFTGFSHQHDPVRLKNGNLMVFDNGNSRSNKYSRVVEYEINENTKTAKKVWDFQMSPNIYTSQMGSAQELENGNILICWGKRITEVTKTKKIVFDMELSSDMSYRAYKYVHDMDAVQLFVDKKVVYNFVDTKYNTNIDLNIDTLSGSGSLTVSKHKYSPEKPTYSSSFVPELLPIRYVINKSDSISLFKAKISINTSNIPEFKVSDSVNIYFRSKENTGNFTQLTTTYNSSTKKLEARITGTGEIVLGYIVPFVPPKITNPVDQIIGFPIKLPITWSIVSFAKNYRLQISKSEAFDVMVLDTMLGRVNSLQTNVFEYYKKYYIRINAFNEKNEATDWSSIAMFYTELAPVILLNPMNNLPAQNVKGTMTWRDVDGAIAYQLQISTSGTFPQSSIIFDKSNLEYSQYNYSNLKYNTQYFWRVRGLQDTVIGSYSQSFSFITRLESPALRFPENNSKNIGSSFEFIWQNYPSYLNFQLQISTDKNFESPEFNFTRIIENRKVVEGLLPNKIYYYRIKVLTLNNESGWTAPFEFFTKLSTPKLISPENNIAQIDINQFLKFSKVTGAEKYQLVLSSKEDFTENLIDTTVNNSINDISLYISKFKFSTIYYWKVRALNINVESDWSEIFNFTTREAEKVNVPLLQLPFDKEKIKVNNEIRFQWTLVGNAKKYQFLLSNSNEFENIFIDTIINVNNYLVNNLTKETKYYWKVIAIGIESESLWSNIREFELVDSLQILPKPNLLIPNNFSNNISLKPILSWEMNELYSEYRLILSKDSLFSKPEVVIIDNILSDNIKDFEKLNIELEYDTKYFWKVHGKNNEILSNWSEIWSFTTIKDPLASIEIENSKLSKLTIFPNPLSEKLNLKISNKIYVTKIVVFDLTGNVVISNLLSLKDIKINNTNDYNYFEFDLSNLQNGNYFIGIYENNGRIFKIEQFIKN